MITQKSKIHQIEKVGAISGILSIIFYFCAAVLSFIPDVIGLLLALAFPLLWIIAFMGLYRFLRKESHTPSLEIAFIFGIIGAAIACSFIVVQQANFIWHDAAMKAATSEELKNLYKASFTATNRVQLGLDIVFDIFVCISWFLFGINIARCSSFNKILGWSGSLLSFALLTLNLYTFPNPPAESGLIDLGPFLALWFLVIVIWWTVVLYKKKSSIVDKI